MSLNNAAYRIEITSFSAHRDGIHGVRNKVFIEEQGIDPALEWDADDASATFAVALDTQGLVLGTARLLVPGRIGRMAVLPEYRRMGIATALLQALLRVAKQRGYKEICLSAQQGIMGLYRKQGFEPVGPAHMEVGIPHQNMQCVL